MYSISNVCGFTDRSRLRCGSDRGRGVGEGCGEIDKELAGIIRRRERERGIEESGEEGERKRETTG